MTDTSSDAVFSKEPIALGLLRLAALVTGAVVFIAWTSADPDLWGHVLFGRDIVAARSLDVNDPYSFTSDRPWVNHEWLAEVLMYFAYAAGGAAGLVTLKTVVVGGVIVTILTTLHQRSWHPLPHDGLIAIALIGMFTRYHPVRPQLFSLLLFALLLSVLSRAERGDRWKLAVLPLIFAAWANLHGGFLVGLGVVATWLVLECVKAPARWASFATVGVCCAAATLLTPYGWGLWRFLFDTVGLSRAGILDWGPAVTSGPIVLVPWLLVLCTGFMALWRDRGRTIPLSSIGIVVLLAVGSARVGRLDAFLALSVVMLLGPAFGLGLAPATAKVRLWPGWALGLGVLVLIAGAVGFTRRASCLEMRGYPEAEATSFLERSGGRLLSFFNWGQYAIWHLSPQIKVSMDGRRETVYSEQLVDAHLRFYRGEPGSMALLDDLSPDIIWVPVSSPSIAAMEQEGWQVAFRGPSSVVLMRHLQAPVVTVLQRSQEVRCFPAR